MRGEKGILFRVLWAGLGAAAAVSFLVVDGAEWEGDRKGNEVSGGGNLDVIGTEAAALVLGINPSLSRFAGYEISVSKKDKKRKKEKKEKKEKKKKRKKKKKKKNKK